MLTAIKVQSRLILLLSLMLFYLQSNGQQQIPSLKDAKVSIQRSFSLYLDQPKKYFKNLITAPKLNDLLPRSSFLLNSADFHSENTVNNSITDPIYYSRTVFYSQLDIAGIPFQVSANRQSFPDLFGTDQFNYSVSFDRNGFLEMAKRKLAGNIDPSSFLENLKTPLDDLLKKTRQELFTDLKDIREKYKGVINGEFDYLGGVKDIFKIDINTLRNRFLSQELMQDITAKQKILADMQIGRNNGEKINEELFTKLTIESLKANALQELLDKLESHKQKWEQSGLLSKIRELDIIKINSLDEFLNKPSTIARLAKQRFNMNGLQRMFFGITHLDIGQNALSSGPLSFEHFLSKGINAGFNSGSKNINILAGRQKDLTSILDYGFTDQIFSNNGLAKAINFEKQGAKIATSLTVSSFSQSPIDYNDFRNGNIFREVLVTTLSNQFRVGETGKFNIELSRSASRYNSKSPNDSFLNAAGNFSKIFSSEDIGNNSAISFRYEDENPLTGLQYYIGFQKTASGYSNPGNSYLNSGTTQFNGRIRKSLLENKLQVTYKADYRIFQYGYENSKWVHSNMMLDLKWKMKKGQYVSMRYQPMRMTSKTPSGKTKLNAYDRLAIDFNIAKKFHHFNYSHFLSLGYENNRYAWMQEMLQKRGLVLSSMQQFTKRTKTIYLNIHFQQFSFYAESGLTYPINKFLIASSAAVYDSYRSWYHRAGLRQSLSGQMGERFILSFFVDWKKNIRLKQFMWDDPFRADLSLKYIIKNKN